MARHWLKFILKSFSYIRFGEKPKVLKKCPLDSRPPPSILLGSAVHRHGGVHLTGLVTGLTLCLRVHRRDRPRRTDHPAEEVLLPDSLPQEVTPRDNDDGCPLVPGVALGQHPRPPHSPSPVTGPTPPELFTQGPEIILKMITIK